MGEVEDRLLPVAFPTMAGGGRVKDISKGGGWGLSLPVRSVEEAGVGRPGRGMAAQRQISSGENNWVCR
jgi:hypothetical protein